MIFVSAEEDASNIDNGQVESSVVWVALGVGLLAFVSILIFVVVMVKAFRPKPQPITIVDPTGKRDKPEYLHQNYLFTQHFQPKIPTKNF